MDRLQLFEESNWTEEGIYWFFFSFFLSTALRWSSRLQSFLRPLHPFHFIPSTSLLSLYPFHFIPFTSPLPLRPFTSLPQIANQIPYAVVEMGGASTQVSQLAPSKAEADAIPIEYRFSFEIEGTELNYLHSVHSIFFMHLLIWMLMYLCIYPSAYENVRERLNWNRCTSCVCENVLMS